MFGNEYGSQAEADAADDLYTQVIETPTTETVTPTFEAGYDVGSGADVDPVSMYESNIYREANVPIPESYMPTSEDFMPGITGTDAPRAEENDIRALYGLPPLETETDAIQTDLDDLLGGGDDLVEGSGVEADELALELGLPDSSLQPASATLDLPTDIPSTDVLAAAIQRGDVPRETLVDQFGVDAVREAESTLLNLPGTEGVPLGDTRLSKRQLREMEDLGILGDTDYRDPLQDSAAIPVFTSTVDDLKPGVTEEDIVDAPEMPIADFAIRDPEEDVNLFPVDIRDPEEDVGLIPDVTTPEDFRRAEAELAGIDFETGQREGGEADREATEDALMDAVKARVSEVEGTSDEGGYDRLLGGQEDRFGITPTEMTVAEILEFQKARGEGTYADYAKDAVGRISTPVGKYQVVGSTLQDLVDRGIVDEDDMFDAATQEEIGSYLIENRGLFNEDISDEQFEKNLGKEFEGIERFGYDGGTSGADQRQESIAAISQNVPTAEITQIQEQLAGAIEPSLLEQGLALGARALIPGFGGLIADQLLTVGPEERQAIVDQHVRALERGATPLYDDDGNYTGFDRSTMGTFADEVLAADDISIFLPPTEGMDAAEIARRADANQDGIPDVERFEEVFEAQQAAADADPYGLSTEEGFIMTGDDGQVGTDDDREFFVTSGGDVVEVRGDGEGEDRDIVDLDLNPEEVDQVINEVLGITEEEEQGEDGPMNPCPEGFVLDPETNECVPIADVGEGDEVGIPRFGDVERDLIRREREEREAGEGLIIRKPKQFARGGPVDLDPNTYDFRGFDTDNPFDLGSVNAMLKHQVGLKTFDDSQMQLYDLNRDGTIDQTDTTAGLQYINYMDDGVFDEARANAEDFYLFTPKMSMAARPTQELSTTVMPEPRPTTGAAGMSIGAPKQFAMGGVATPNIDKMLNTRRFAQGGAVTPNIDSFVRSMRG